MHILYFCFFHHTKHIWSKHQNIQITVKVSKWSISSKICCKCDLMLLLTISQTILLVHVIIMMCMHAFSKSSVRMSFVLFVRTVLLVQWTFQTSSYSNVDDTKSQKMRLFIVIYYMIIFRWICWNFLQLGYLQMSYARTT